MLVAFHSSPFSAPLQTGIPNRGFELDVDMLFADSDSYDFAKGTANKCEFLINASKPGKYDRNVMPQGVWGYVILIFVYVCVHTNKHVQLYKQIRS